MLQRFYAQALLNRCSVTWQVFFLCISSFQHPGSVFTRIMRPSPFFLTFLYSLIQFPNEEDSFHKFVSPQEVLPFTEGTGSSLYRLVKLDQAIIFRFFF